MNNIELCIIYGLACIGTVFIIAILIGLSVKGYFSSKNPRPKKQRVIKKLCEHFWIPVEVDICDAQDSDGIRVTQVLQVKEVYCARCRQTRDFWYDEED